MVLMCEKFGMETTPNYDMSHLVVAAARVLAHKLEKPPTYEEIGELLGISHEVIGAIARALETRGIVKIRMTPFDTRVDVADHTALEELPRDDRGAAIKEEVDAFVERSKEKQESIDKLFGEEEFQKRKKELRIRFYFIWMLIWTVTGFRRKILIL